MYPSSLTHYVTAWRGGKDELKKACVSVQVFGHQEVSMFELCHQNCGESRCLESRCVGCLLSIHQKLPDIKTQTWGGFVTESCGFMDITCQVFNNFLDVVDAFETKVQPRHLT